VSADDDHQIGYQALPRGVPVHASDGAIVGRVHRVLDNAREHIFDGIGVSTRDGQRFVDAPEVVRITEMRVTLGIDSMQAKTLPRYGGMPGAMETRAKRMARKWKRRFSR